MNAAIKKHYFHAPPFQSNLIKSSTDIENCHLQVGNVTYFQQNTLITTLPCDPKRRGLKYCTTACLEEGHNINNCLVLRSEIFGHLLTQTRIQHLDCCR